MRVSVCGTASDRLGCDHFGQVSENIYVKPHKRNGFLFLPVPLALTFSECVLFNRKKEEEKRQTAPETVALSFMSTASHLALTFWHHFGIFLRLARHLRPYFSGAVVSASPLCPYRLLQRYLLSCFPLRGCMCLKTSRCLSPLLSAKVPSRVFF